MAEFSALRSEILDLNNAQRALISLNLTASATLTGFAVAGDRRAGLMVVVAFLSSTLGLLYINYARAIRRAGDYIWERLSGDLDMEWELWLRTRKTKEKLWGVLEQTVPTGLIFFAPAVAGLIFSHSQMGKFGGLGPWLAALGYVGLYVVVAVLYLFAGPYRAWRQSRALARTQ